jgi:hypothetical protein
MVQAPTVERVKECLLGLGVANQRFGFARVRGTVDAISLWDQVVFGEFDRSHERASS